MDNSEDSGSDISSLPPPITDEEQEHNFKPSSSISEDEAEMSVALTQYFQDQRKVFEQVSVGGIAYILSVVMHTKYLLELPSKKM